MSTPPLPAPQPRRRTSPWVIVLIVLGVVGAIVAVVGMMVGIPAEVEPGDRERVVSVAAFDEYFDLGLTIDPGREQLTRTRYLDGSYDIDYEYTTADESLYLSTSISHSRSERDARSVYAGMTVMIGASFKVLGDGVEPVDEPGMITRGDERRAGFLTYAGQRTGVYAVVREGEDVVLFMMAGYAIEPEDARGLLEPVLDSL